MIKSEIIADSLNKQDIRLTTFVLEYPRYVHSEIMTHRVFSRNAASSRAIPIEKFIQQVKENPALPTHWGVNRQGMQASEELDNILERPRAAWGCGHGEDCMMTDMEYAEDLWLAARDKMIEFAGSLNDLGLHKQITNRILEAWFHIRIILSGTEFENFFALRAHKDAHPDFQKLAYMMLEQYNASEPQSLAPGKWHVPFGDRLDPARLTQLRIAHPNETQEELIHKISAARCARISYLNYEGKDDYESDLKLCDRLFGSVPKHMTPAEHVAMAMDDTVHYGNFTGWRQLRHFFPQENLSDPRVIKKTYKARHGSGIN